MERLADASFSARQRWRWRWRWRYLAKGTPRVELEVLVTKDPVTTTWHATARTRVLRDGEELLVADRLRAVFLEGARR